MATMASDETAAGEMDAVSRYGRLLRPRSVAIVGASDKPGALGASILGNLEAQSFGGDIHLVNPKRAEIGGRPCVASVDDLPEGIDVAVLAIPRAGVLDVIRGLARRRVGAAIVFSAGFAEDGPRGMADQQEIAQIAEEAGMLIEGPNCLGLVNFSDRIPLTFIELPEARARGDRRVGIAPFAGVRSSPGRTGPLAGPAGRTGFREGRVGVPDPSPPP